MEPGRHDLLRLLCQALAANYSPQNLRSIPSIRQPSGPRFGQGNLHVERTRDLFKTIADADRSVAEKFFRIALESLVDTKEFSLARSFMPDPQKQIEQFAMPFKFGRQSTPSVSSEFQEAQEVFVRIYVKNVSRILQVFLGVGEENVANHLRHYALECVADAQLRDRIMERLYSSPPPTQIQ
jgi:hypothetical protein